MRLIDAEALIEEFKKIYHCAETMEELANTMEDAIDNAPTVERPKGKWIYDADFPMFGSPYGSYKCSECGMHTDDGEDNFCWFCGAKMSTKENDNV